MINKTPPNDASAERPRRDVSETAVLVVSATFAFESIGSEKTPQGVCAGGCVILCVMRYVPRSSSERNPTGLFHNGGYTILSSGSGGIMVDGHSVRYEWN